MAGAQANGMNVIFHDLNQPGIRGCQHCYYCRQHEGCALKDDPLNSMYQDIIQADAILLGTPIYFYHLAGQTKIWLDRMFPMFDTPSYKSRYPGKRSVTVFSQGYTDPTLYQTVIKEMNDRFNRWGWTVEDSLLAIGSELPEWLLDRAYQAGKLLANK